MVRYMTMKRITQVLASVLFVITVLTIYLAFDFAISNAISHKHSAHKRHNQQHEPNHPHDPIKITKKRSIETPILNRMRKSNHTIQHQDHNVNNEHIMRNNKLPVHGKPAIYHKSKTGVKVNKPQKSLKDQRKRLSTSTTYSQHKDKHFDDKRHI